MIGLEFAVITAAAASMGIFDSDALAAHLGVRLGYPASAHMIAVILTRLPVTLDTAFTMSPEVRSTDACFFRCVVRRTVRRVNPLRTPAVPTAPGAAVPLRLTP